VRRLRFIWVDDKKEKVEPYRDVLQDGFGKRRAKVELLEVKDNVLQTLDDWSQENKTAPPDLIIIDHVFTLALPFGLRGSSVAHLLRGLFPVTPMVCVTAMFDRPGSFDQEDISEYSALFLYQRLEDHIEDLYAIAEGFRKLHAPKLRIREHLIACTKAPPRDKADLLRVLPGEFQDKRHAATEHRMASWIYNVLLARPGFLYDRLHAATLLGLTEAGFRKVEGMFGKAAYRGVFATQGTPHWWVSALRRILFQLSADDGPDLPQHVGRALPGIVPGDYSVCYVSKTSEPPPDAVVSTDATRDAEQRVVRSEYADRHPSDPGTTPGFEARLVLRKRRK